MKLAIEITQDEWENKYHRFAHPEDDLLVFLEDYLNATGDSNEFDVTIICIDEDDCSAVVSSNEGNDLLDISWDDECVIIDVYKFDLSRRKVVYVK